MGIFDFLFKGPELYRHEARTMVTDLAMHMYRGKASPKDLVIHADVYLEHQFLKWNFGDRSINSEQSKQIIRVAILQYENDKAYLEQLMRRQDYINENPNLRATFKDLPLSTIKMDEMLTLFKDPSNEPHSPWVNIRTKTKKPNQRLMKIEKGMSAEKIASDLEELLRSQGIKIVEDKKKE